MPQMSPLDAIPGLSEQSQWLNYLRVDVSTIREFLKDTERNGSPVIEVSRVSLQNLSDSWEAFEQAWSTTRRTRPVTEREQRFWNRVQVQPGGHYLWTGMGRDRPDGIPLCDWTSGGRKIRTTAARVAWIIEKGSDIPDRTYLRRTCSVPRCVAPAHHQLSSDPARLGKRSNLRYNAAGQPVCKLGHTLKSVPRPGVTVYCPTCYTIGKQAIRALESATDHQYTKARFTTPIYPPVINPEPLSVNTLPERWTPDSGRLPTKADVDRARDEVMALFDDASPRDPTPDDASPEPVPEPDSV